MPEFHDELFDRQTEPVVHRYCCPILIGSFSFGAFLEPPEHLLVQPGKELPRLRSGTLTFVRHDGEFYGITCAHVIDALNQSIEADKRHLETACSGEVPYPPEVWNRFFFPAGDTHFDVNVRFVRAPDHNVDLAAGWIPPDIFDAIGRQALDIGLDHELPEQWPDEAGGLASGYPEANRRIYGRGESDDTLAISNVTLRSGIEKPVGRKIRMFGALRPEEVVGVDVLSGMSGGPILVTCGERWGLAGIISGGSDLNSHAKSGNQSFFDGPAINIEGEALVLPRLRSWLDSLKGNRPERPTRHIKIHKSRDTRTIV
jgi:hypothetical protein